MKKLRIILLMALLNILLSPVGAISIKNETKPKAVIPATKQAPAGPNSPQNAGKEVKRQIQSSVSVIKPMKTNGKVLSVSASQTKPSNDSDGKKDVIKVAPLKIIAQPIAELKPSTVPPKTPSTPNPKPPVTAIVKQKEAPKSQVVGEKKPQEKSPPVKSKLEEVSKELETLKKEVKDLQAGVIKGKKTQKAVEKSKKIIFKIVPSGAKRNEQTKKNDMKKNDKKVEQKKGAIVASKKVTAKKNPAMKPIPAISKPLVLQNINPTIPKKPTEILSDKSKAKTEVKTVNRQEKSKKKVDEVKNAPKLVVVVQQNPLEGHKVAPIVPTSSVQATATALMETKIKAMSVNIV